MNSIEEQLWNYIDGLLPDAEQQAIARLIEQDKVYHTKYHELLQLNSEFDAMELEEPPMAFTYNVMETIRTQNAMQPLKAGINKRVIWAIAAFFIISITALLLYALGTVNWHAGDGLNTTEQFNIKLPHLNNYFTGPVIKAFLFVDAVMFLFFLDNYLRRKSISKG